MEIKQARAKKNDLEAKIKEMLLDFEKQTGMIIRSIEVKRHGLVRGHAEPPIGSIKKLPSRYK